MKYKALNILASLAMFLNAGIALAQQTPDPPSSNSTLSESKSSLPNALRVTFSNAIKDFVQNTSKVTVNLEWDLLPDSTSINEAAALQGQPPYLITLHNNNLGQFLIGEDKDANANNNWLADIKGDKDYSREEKIAALKEALCGQNNCDIGSKESLDRGVSNFQKVWGIEGENTKKFVTTTTTSSIKTPLIKPSEYFGLSRDEVVLHALLLSKGIGYSVDVEGATPFNPLPISSDGSDIRWEIRLYKVTKSYRENNEDKQISFYRSTIKAVIEKPVNLVFPDSDTDRQVVLKPQIAIREGVGFGGVLTRSLIPDSISGNVEAAVKAPYENLLQGRGNSTIDTNFLLIGNATLGNVFSKGLIGNAENLSIVGGGLIGSRNVEPLIGANLGLARLGSDASAGVLFGVSNEETLYLGPSFQISALTVSGGVAVSEENKDTEVDARGMISVDVSRLLSGRQDVQPLKIDPTNTGGNWGVASDAISQELALV
jgi:hypothetical protein